MTRWICLLPLCLAGCLAATPGKFTGPPVAVSEGGHDFRLYITPDRTHVEAHRVNMAWRPSTSGVINAAGQAIVRTTGCQIVSGSLHGDAAIVTADLNCPDLS